MSTLRAAGVWVSDGRRMLLAPTTVSVSTGEIVAVYGDPGHRHALFALALGGRLAEARGEVDVDGDAAAETRQRQVALVDVPGVSEPDEVSGLTTIVGEELAMAGRPAGRGPVDDWLTANGLRPHRGDRVEDLPAGLRTLALARLASLRPGVQFLVLALPERNGIDPEAWLEDAIALAEAGFGVLATMSTGIARHVERDHPGIRTVPFGNAQFADAQFADAQFADAQFADAQFADAQFADAQFADAQFTDDEPTGEEPTGDEPTGDGLQTTEDDR